MKLNCKKKKKEERATTFFVEQCGMKRWESTSVLMLCNKM